MSLDVTVRDPINGADVSKEPHFKTCNVEAGNMSLHAPLPEANDTFPHANASCLSPHRRNNWMMLACASEMCEQIFFWFCVVLRRTVNAKRAATVVLNANG